MKAIKYAILGLIGVIGMLVSMFGPVRIPFVESVAKTYYRYALGAVLVILLFITAILGLFILAFDANNFKSEITQYVKEHTQRELLIEGDIKVTFFPKLGLNTGKMSLTQRNSARVFASINNARLYIAWWPLLRRQLVFDHVVIDGIRANAVRLKDGSTNFGDLLISDGDIAPLTFNIDSVLITDSSINWQDELDTQRFALHGLQLEIGRVADKTPSSLSASFNIVSEKPSIDTRARLKSRLFFDLQAGRYEFADLEGRLEGRAGQLDHLSLDFSGSMDSHPTQGLLAAEDLAVSSTGKFGQRDVTAKLIVPHLKVSDNVYTGEQLAFDASFLQANESFSVATQLPAFEFANRTLSAAKINADFDFTSEGRVLRGKLISPLDINLNASSQRIQLDPLSLSFTASSPVLAGEIGATANGSLLVDYAAMNAQLAFNANVDDSTIMGNVVIKDFTHPLYTVEVNTSQIDIGRYIASEWIEHLGDDATKIDTAGFKDVELRGKLRSDEISLNHFRARKFAADITIGQSKITVSPLTAQLYGGSLVGDMNLAVQELPRISVRQSLKGVQVGQMLASTTNKLVGTGDIDLDISAQGSNIGELLNSLNGSVSVALSHGSLSGFDLRRVMADGKAELGTANVERIIPANFGDKTDYSDLKALFNLENGKASCKDFEMNSPFIRTAGEGYIDFGSGNLDYRLNATVSSVINRRTARDLIEYRGVTVPIRVSGPYSSPSIAINFAAASGGNIASLVAANAAKNEEVSPVQSTAKANRIRPKKIISGSSASSKSKVMAVKPPVKSQP